jgi:Holliday junction resolvasome RuvABC endonuclease subunit
MSVLRILAIDPALANFGLARFFYDTSAGKLSLVGLKLIETEPGGQKGVRKNSDDLRRATEHYEAIKVWMDVTDVLMAEIPHGAQSARASLSNGVCYGLLAAASTYRPLIQVTAAEVKKTVTGRVTATKDEMIEWATKAYPEAEWKRRKLKGVMELTDKNEHLADACAIAHTGILTAEFKSAARIAQQFAGVISQH